jgi:class 3 adenylate cyclase/pimeloyl-ACP methyl ester carboxylesterase
VKLSRVQSPETRYARSGDVSIAYQVMGEGPLDLVFVPPSITHLELGWSWERHARMLRALADFSRLIIFDKRGMGMSDRVTHSTTFEQRMDDIRAVMDAAGSERAALFGLSEGGSMAILFAATYPARTTALVVYGAVVRKRWAPDFPFGNLREEPTEDELAADAADWGRAQAVEEMARAMTPDAEEEEIRALVAMLRYGATPGAVSDLERLNAVIDVRPALTAIRTPTLVLHNTGDPWVPVEQGRFAAQHIRGAKLVELPGETHVPLAHEVEPLVREVRTFVERVLSGGWDAPEPDRVLATVLFTDIVGSTAKLAELGDRAWRGLLEQHHSLIREQLAQFRGIELDTAGDGFFARFDGPARAVRCACAVREAVREIDLEIRAGLHTGECEVVDDKVAGIAVNIGARVAAEAGPGDVLVSSTVKDLVAGSGIEFREHGAAELKGVPGEWRLFAVETA